MKGIILSLFIIGSLVSIPISTVNEYPENKDTSKLSTELRCMELNLYHEARGESKSGMIAVGHVILNRVRDKRFPNAICAVVFQKHQFSWTSKYKNKKLVVPRHIRNIAYKLLTTDKYKDTTKGSLYFHNKSVGPFNRRQTVTIGRHIFYR
jgi:spore germination cell wall hydrolase CwlJ-like protein